MGKKRKKQEITIVLEMPLREAEEAPAGAADIFITQFLKVITYWIIGAVALAIIGFFLSII